MRPWASGATSESPTWPTSPPDDGRDLELHQEIVKAYLKERTIKGAARESGHDRDTVKAHVKDHFTDKSCSCYGKAT